MISFTCDYNEGAHPEILKRLTATNMQQEPGYGFDTFTKSAQERIRTATGMPQAEVRFLVGGTQTNQTIIDALLPHYAAVIAVETGHIAVHESGAIEFSGHKVITIPAHEGKMCVNDLSNYLARFFADPTWPHMAVPGMVYLSFPTEYGTIYSRQELHDIYDVCKHHNLKLFVDGARLGYGLCSKGCDIDLHTLCQLCDVFYIGGTKVGALCGEAVVFPKGDVPRNFLTIVKQHGALLAKGRLLGLQFDTLFTDGLYLHIAQHAIDMAMELQRMFKRLGIPFYIDSPSNQQFPILTASQMEKLAGKVDFEIWEPRPDGSAVTRFATSWATAKEHIVFLESCLQQK